jgi:hypothetical protein
LADGAELLELLLLVDETEPPEKPPCDMPELDAPLEPEEWPELEAPDECCTNRTSETQRTAATKRPESRIKHLLLRGSTGRHPDAVDNTPRRCG